MKRCYLLLLLCTAISFCTSAQIGYQVSLLNNATGEPRANERVTLTVKITDSEGKTVCEETKNDTSNDFGVISMSVGDSDTFTNADWSKLPFFIEASIDGRHLGKSQLLSVPVAEHAKHTGSLTKDLLCAKEWIHESEDDCRKIIFNPNGRYTEYYQNKLWPDDSYQSNGMYIIDGDVIYKLDDGDYEIYSLNYTHEWKCIFRQGEGRIYKQPE